MNRSSMGWVLLIAAVGMAFGLLGAEISQLPDWRPVLQPAFVGKALAHLATVIAAYVSGQLVPTAAKLKGE